MPRRFAFVSWAVVLSVVFGVATDRTAHAARWGKDYLPNVELVTQDGKTVRFYDDVVKGKLIVFSFIYTTCRDICPLITARLAQVYDKLGDVAGRDVHFVSISIDPENDTPALMKEHADTFRDDPRWLFLTGTPENVGKVRYKLGERSRKLTEHGAMIMMFNDLTGEWSRDSAFGDLGAVVLSIRAMKPEWRDRPVEIAANPSPGAAPATAELPGQALFVKACASCHTVGAGVRVGPDLKGLTERRERAWLHRFIKSPKTLHAQKDPVALALAREYPTVRMPNLLLSSNDVDDLLAYLEFRSFAAEAPAGGHAHDHATAHAAGHAHDHGEAAGHDKGGSKRDGKYDAVGQNHDHDQKHDHKRHSHGHR
ncbi:MAG: SCO family protein [Alphaproteobacteria bacterium]|nr:SCO family protein [Alphaproteobacteria bacterium]